jgi:hypothetical protein
MSSPNDVIGHIKNKTQTEKTDRILRYHKLNDNSSSTVTSFKSLLHSSTTMVDVQTGTATSDQHVQGHEVCETIKWNFSFTTFYDVSKRTKVSSASQSLNLRSN